MRVYSFLEKNNLISKRQFAFRSGYSSNHTIVNLVECIKKYIDNGNYVCFWYRRKLYHYCIWGLAHNWFRLYLSNGQQFVFISDTSSELMSINCGVPPGSTLGPLLLLLYISDLNSVFNKAIMIHLAYDTPSCYVSKMLSTIESVMNYELKKLAEWLRSNKLSLNFKKSELVIFCSKTKLELDEIKIKISKFKLAPVQNILISLAFFLTTFFSGMLM